MTVPAAVQKLDLEKLFAARLYAVRVRPYLATALFALHIVESRRVLLILQPYPQGDRVFLFT